MFSTLRQCWKKLIGTVSWHDLLFHCFLFSDAEPNIYDILQFITGYRSIPWKIFIRFSKTNEMKLPDPGVCTEEIMLPVSHTTYMKFKQAFDTTVSCQGTGFGRYWVFKWPSSQCAHVYIVHIWFINANKRSPVAVTASFRYRAMQAIFWFVH